MRFVFQCRIRNYAKRFEPTNTTRAVWPANVPAEVGGGTTGVRSGIHTNIY